MAARREMSQQALQKMVGTAVVDRRFRQKLLNGRRQRLLRWFELTPAEQETVLSINKDTLEGFAAELEYRLNGLMPALPFGTTRASVPEPLADAWPGRARPRSVPL